MIDRAGGDSVQLTQGVTEAPVTILVRLRSDRCCSADPPPPVPSPKGGRLDVAARLASGASQPLDLARRRRLRSTALGPPARGRPAPAVGTPLAPDRADARPGPADGFGRLARDGHAGERGVSVKRRIDRLQMVWPAPDTPPRPVFGDAEWAAVWARLPQDERKAAAAVLARYAGTPGSVDGWPPLSALSDEDLEFLTAFVGRCEVIARELGLPVRLLGIRSHSLRRGRMGPKTGSWCLEVLA